MIQRLLLRRSGSKTVPAPVAFEYRNTVGVMEALFVVRDVKTLSVLIASPVAAKLARTEQHWLGTRFQSRLCRTYRPGSFGGRRRRNFKGSVERLAHAPRAGGENRCYS